MLVTEALPKGVDRFALVDGVWVCNYSAVVALVGALRWSLQQVSLVRLADQNRTDKAQVLYDYVTGQEFRQRVEAILDHFSSMRDELESEKRCYQRQWAKREKHLASIQQNVAEMFGAFEGIAGQLGTIETLQLAS